MSENHGVPDSNFKPSLTLIDFSTNNPFAWEGSSSLGAGYVQIVDNSGTPIVSFGGGTQYTDAGTPPAHPVGNALVFDNGSSAWQAVNSSHGLPVNVVAGSSGNAAASATGSAVPSSADYLGFNSAGNLVGVSSAAPLPITIISGNPTSITANAGTNLNTSALALESGGNLATLAGIVSSSKAATKMADGDLATLGNKADGKSTATDTTAVTIMQVLKQISYMEQNPASTPVTGTFWQTTQPVSIASGAAVDGSIATLGTKTDAKSTATDTTSASIVSILKEISYMEQNPASRAVTNAGTFPVQSTLQTGSNIVGKVGIDQTTIGTTNGVTPVPSAAGGTGWQFKQFGDGTVGTDWNGAKQQIVGTAATFGGYVMLFNPNTTTSFIQVFNKTSANVTLGTTVPDMVIPLPGVASASATGAAANNEIVNGVKFSTALTVAVTTTAGGSTAPASKIYGCILYN